MSTTTVSTALTVTPTVTVFKLATPKVTTVTRTKDSTAYTTVLQTENKVAATAYTTDATITVTEIQSTTQTSAVPTTMTDSTTMTVYEPTTTTVFTMINAGILVRVEGLEERFNVPKPLLPYQDALSDACLKLIYGSTADTPVKITRTKTVFAKTSQTVTVTVGKTQGTKTLRIATTVTQTVPVTVKTTVSNTLTKSVTRTNTDTLRVTDVITIAETAKTTEVKTTTLASPTVTTASTQVLYPSK